MGALLLASAIIFNTLANSLFKLGSDIQEWTPRKGVLLGAGLFLGLLNTLCYIKALERTDLGTAYPLFSAASIVLIALVSYVVFREMISVQKAIGLATVCVGLAILWKA